jgi:hypothetical protein
MGKIYLNLKERNEENQFVGSDGKKHDKLWTIERKITGNMQLSGATINGEARYIDGTVPTDVEKLPRDAKPVPNELAEKLYNSNSHYFGE